MAMRLTSNSPQAGYIAWTGVSISYKGQTYAIADGSTNYTYVYWLYSNPTVFYGSNTFPTLGIDDILVFLNKDGVGAVIPNTTIVDGSLIVPDSIMTQQIAANAITSTELSANAVTAGKIAANAVTAGTVAANAIGAGAIAAGAITSDKIAAGAITSGTIAANAVGAAAIAANAISSDKIQSYSIVATDLVMTDFNNLSTADEAFAASMVPVGTFGGSVISGGYIKKPAAANAYLMLCDYTPNPLKNGDEIYFEFSGMAAAAASVTPTVWIYDASKGNTGSQAATSAISLTTTEAKYSCSIKINNATFDTAVYYLIGFPCTNVDISVRQCRAYRKNGANLIVDGSITAAKMVAGTITAASGILASAAVGTAQIADGAITNAKIANASIDSAKIANIDAGKITTGTLNAINITASTYTASGTNDRSETTTITIGGSNFDTTGAYTPIYLTNSAKHFELSLGDDRFLQYSYNTTSLAMDSWTEVYPGYIQTGTLRNDSGLGNHVGVAILEGNHLALQDASHNTQAEIIDGAMTLTGGITASGELSTGGGKFKTSGSTLLTNQGNLKMQLANNQYMDLEEGLGGVIWKGNWTRLVILDDPNYTPGMRIERWDGAKTATLTVASTVYNSDASIKKNIEDYPKSGLDEINSTPVRYYNFDTEIDNVDLKHVGIIMQEAPLDAIDMSGQGVDGYAMTALAWKAIQELSAKIDALTARVTALETPTTA